MFKPDLMIDLQWLNRVSFRLERFKKGSGKHTYLCRCPYCGDSKKSKRKTRLAFYVKKQNLNFKCFNCDAHGSFYKFMREQFSSEFDEYKKEQLLRHFNRFESTSSQSNSNTHLEEDNAAGSVPDDFYDIITPVSELPDDHKAKQYLINRSFTEREWKHLYYSDNFKEVAEFVSYNEISENFPDEPRIVIPFYDEHGQIKCVQGRSLNPKSSLKYITIKSGPDVDKVYGLERVDRKKTVYCVEGPLDSLFIDNCLASGDANLTSVKADVYIFDNQPRNKEIVELMRKAIESGHQVVIWPNSPNGKEDINDLIQMGVPRDLLMRVIKTRTFRGPFARLEFSKWKRV